MNLIPCPLCNSIEFKHVYSDSRPLPTENRHLVQCLNCTHVFVNPVKPQIYDDVNIEVFDCDLQPGAENRFDYFYNQVMTIWGKPPGTLLEVGCGMGHFIKRAQKGGWEVHGIEPSTKVAKWANENAVPGRVENEYYGPDFAPMGFNVLVGIEVLEHTPKPEEFLWCALNKSLLPGGLLYLTVPNFSCLKDRPKNKWHEWPAMIPFGHLQFFKPGTLVQLLHDTGFKNIGMLTQCGDEQLVVWGWK